MAQGIKSIDVKVNRSLLVNVEEGSLAMAVAACFIRASIACSKISSAGRNVVVVSLSYDALSDGCISS